MKVLTFWLANVKITHIIQSETWRETLEESKNESDTDKEEE